MEGRTLPHPSPHDEEEMWQRLDVALEEALRDPDAAYRLAFHVWLDSRDHPDVRRACDAFLSVFWDPPR